MSADSAALDEIEIELLADCPQTIDALRAWFETVWAPYYGHAGPGDAEADLRAACRRQGLPIALVARTGGRLCGTAALKEESLQTHRHLGPWLAALMVLPAYRRRGVGERLIAAVEALAVRSGFDRIYAGAGLGPGTPESALRRRGWTFIEKGPYARTEIAIFRKTLPTGSP